MCDPVVAQIVLLMEQERSLILECQEVDSSSISVALLTFGSNLEEKGLWGQPVAYRGCSHRRSPLHAGLRRIWHDFETLRDPCTPQTEAVSVLRVRCRRDCEVVTPQKIELPISVFPRQNKGRRISPLMSAGFVIHSRSVLQHHGDAVVRLAGRRKVNWWRELGGERQMSEAAGYWGPVSAARVQRFLKIVVDRVMWSTHRSF